MKFKINTQIYIDSSSISEVNKYRKLLKISGITTNPTIMKNDGVKNYYNHCKKISKKFSKLPVSLEVLSDNYNDILDQSLKLNKISKNVYVKIPIVNSKGYSNLKIIKKLLEYKIKINVTAILDKKQIKDLSDCVNSKDDVIVSIFAGRIADTLRDPIDHIKYAKKLFFKKSNSKILWASCREVLNIQQASNCRCDIVTVSPSILSKLKMYKMSLKELSISTSLMFYNDAKKANFKI